MNEKEEIKDEAVDIDDVDREIYNAYLKLQYLSTKVILAGYDYKIAVDTRLTDIRDYYLWETLDALKDGSKTEALMQRFSRMIEYCHDPSLTPSKYLNDLPGLTTVGFIEGYFFALNQLMMLYHQVIPSHIGDIGISKKGLSRKEFEESWMKSKKYLSNRFLDHLMRGIK